MVILGSLSGLTPELYSRARTATHEKDTELSEFEETLFGIVSSTDHEALQTISNKELELFPSARPPPPQSTRRVYPSKQHTLADEILRAFEDAVRNSVGRDLGYDNYQEWNRSSGRTPDERVLMARFIVSHVLVPGKPQAHLSPSNDPI